MPTSERERNPTNLKEVKPMPEKFSRKREALYNALRATTVHPTAEWLYAALRPEYPDLSLGTVYRIRVNGIFPDHYFHIRYYFWSKTSKSSDFRFYSRCFSRSDHYPSFGTLFPKYWCGQRMGNGFHRYRWFRIHLELEYIHILF